VWARRRKLTESKLTAGFEIRRVDGVYIRFGADGSVGPDCVADGVGGCARVRGKFARLGKGSMSKKLAEDYVVVGLVGLKPVNGVCRA
jgi:hypothetical protein